MPDAGVVCNHEATDPVGRLNIGTFLAEGNLDRGRSPFDKMRQFPLPHPLERLVQFRRVHLTLDNIEYVHILPVLLGRSAHHQVGGVEEAAHHVQNCCFFDVGGLRLDCEWGVGGHKEVAPRGGDEGSEDAGHVVVHVGRVAEGGCRGGHDGGDEGVHLAEVRVGDFETLGCDAVEGVVVEHHH